MLLLPSESEANRAEISLSFFRADRVPELIEIVEDVACDHPDEDPRWEKAGKYHVAGSANRKLAERLIELAPEYISQHSLKLLNRRSSQFKTVMLGFLLEKKCQPLDRFLGLALAEPDDHQLWNYMWQFKLGLVQANLSLELRNRLFDMLVPFLQRPQEQFNKINYCELLSTVHPERASHFFSTNLPIDPNTPLLDSILRQPGFLRSDHCIGELNRLFDFFTRDVKVGDREWIKRVASIVSAVRAKQSPELQPILEKCISRPEPSLRRSGLEGLIDLKLPYGPVRKSLELVQSKLASKLAIPVRVVGFASLYETQFNTHSILEFAESVKMSEYVACMEALGELKEWDHLALLTDVREELGDDPRRGLRQKGTRQRIFKHYGPRAEQLDMEQIEESIHRYVLEHESEFHAIRAIEVD